VLTDTDTRPFDVRRDEDRAKVRKALLAGIGPYANISPAERAELLKMLDMVDASAAQKKQEEGADGSDLTQPHDSSPQHSQ